MWLSWLACADDVGSNRTSTPPPQDTDSGDELRCSPEPIHLASCVDATTPSAPPGSGIFETSGLGTVTEVGRAVAASGGSASFGEFRPCSGNAGETFQIRLVDEAGASWTFGVDAPPGLPDEDLAAIVPVGAAVRFLVRWNDTDGLPNCSPAQAFALTSTAAAGLRLSVEEGMPLLTADERGGLSITLDGTDRCVVTSMESHDRVDLAWPDGAASLRSGESADLSLASGALHVFVAEAYRNCDDCFCANDQRQVISWAEP